jgi:phospholipase/carboxylesterase
MDIDRQAELPVPHYYQLAIPEAASRKRLPLLVGLHGYAGDMVSMMRLARGIAEQDMIVASVQGPHQFLSPPLEEGNTEKIGFGWLTKFRSEDSQARHHRLIRAVIEDAEKHYHADARRVFIMGFSQACALNYRLVLSHPGLFRGVIGVCGGLPGDLDCSGNYRRVPAAVLHIAAARDQYYSLKQTRTFESALRRFSEDVTYREYESPHAFPRRSLPFIRSWILERC